MSAGLQRAAHLATLTRYLGTPYPASGQTWQDCDKRGRGERTILVLSVDEQDGVMKARVAVYEKGVDTGRRSSISIKRFVPTSTGYRYIQDWSKE